MHNECLNFHQKNIGHECCDTLDLLTGYNLTWSELQGLIFVVVVKYNQINLNLESTLLHLI